VLHARILPPVERRFRAAVRSVAVTRRIEIVPYDERWPAEFARISDALADALGDLALAIDHIGSTSVPGLGAKDVIDVQVTAADLDDPRLGPALARAGYQLRPDRVEDHRPPGDLRPAIEWQKRYAREPAGARRTHVHIRAAGRANQRYALLFRDYLRADRAAAHAYEAAKRALVTLHPEDIDAYLAVKDPICDLVLAAAEQWASRTLQHT
jgi:GrpB-like predicted nucleotidyltransferase (UPF0157 family)